MVEEIDPNRRDIPSLGGVSFCKVMGNSSSQTSVFALVEFFLENSSKLRG